MIGKPPAWFATTASLDQALADLDAVVECARRFVSR